jgi:hypothetical protein
MSVSNSSVKPCLLILVRLAFVVSQAFCSVRIVAQQPSVILEAELVQPLDAGHAETLAADHRIADWIGSGASCTLGFRRGGDRRRVPKMKGFAQSNYAG